MKVIDVVPAKGFMQEFIASTNYHLAGMNAGKKIEVKTPDPYGDSVLVVDKSTGCHFKGSKLIHTDACMCGEE